MEWILKKLFAIYENSKSANTFWREWNGTRYSAHPLDKLAYFSERHPAAWEQIKNILTAAVSIGVSVAVSWFCCVTVRG